MINIDWADAPEEATHYYVGSDSPWRDLQGKDWRWWHDGRWCSPNDEGFPMLVEGLDTSSAGLLERNYAYLIPRP